MQSNFSTLSREILYLNDVNTVIKISTFRIQKVLFITFIISLLFPTFYIIRTFFDSLSISFGFIQTRTVEIARDI